MSDTAVTVTTSLQRREETENECFKNTAILELSQRKVQDQEANILSSDAENEVKSKKSQ